MHSLISGFDHYIQSPKPELFDLANDPHEKRNMLTENRRTYVALREAIAPFVKGAEAPKAIDPEQAKQLAALGYVGSAAVTASDAELPDPKDHLGSVNGIKLAFLASQEHRYEDTARDCAQLLRDNPNLVDVWSVYAQALGKLGRYDEAIAAAKEGMKRAPTNTAFAVMIANIGLEQNMLDLAEAHAKLIAKDAPNESHNLLAQIYIERKDYARAEQEANAWLAGNRDKPFVLTLLGRVAMERGKLDEALRYFDQALALNEEKGRPPVPRLNFFRGDALAREGRAEEAEAAFRKEIELFPADPQAYKNLLLLYAVEGKIDAATQLTFSLEKAAPTPPAYAAISETLKSIGDTNGAHFWAARGLQHFPRDRHLQALLRG
jgi:tetratricopeptide (TPR) repeat protein